MADGPFLNPKDLFLVFALVKQEISETFIYITAALLAAFQNRL